MKIKDDKYTGLFQFAGYAFITLTSLACLLAVPADFIRIHDQERIDRQGRVSYDPDGVFS
ncbi:hypothetical protein LJK87_21165 [Paenibacillus sp. P25]|nr:hypothetical protein LJK87_21165 [Paenibacillus sp. P25]